MGKPVFEISDTNQAATKQAVHQQMARGLKFGVMEEED